MENLIEQFGLSDDLEYQRLLRIAEYTQDYSKLEKKLDDIITKQKQVASGTYTQDINTILFSTRERFSQDIGATGAMWSYTPEDEDELKALQAIPGLYGMFDVYEGTADISGKKYMILTLIELIIMLNYIN